MKALIVDDLLGKPVVWHPERNARANELLLGDESGFELQHSFPMVTGVTNPEVETLSAMYHALLVTAHTIRVSGGVPNAAFYMFSNEDGIQSAQESPVARPYTEWSGLSRLIFARSVLDAALADDDITVILHVSTSDSIMVVRDGVHVTRAHQKITGWHMKTGLAWTHYAPLHDVDGRTVLGRGGSHEAWVSWEHEFDRIDASLKEGDGRRVMNDLRRLLLPQSIASVNPEDTPELVQPTNAFSLWLLKQIAHEAEGDANAIVERVMSDLDFDPELASHVHRLIRELVNLNKQINK